MRYETFKISAHPTFDTRTTVMSLLRRKKADEC